MDFFTSILFFLLPIYVANSSAMVFGGGTPLDLDTKWMDQKPILGKGKTFKGTFFGVFFGTMTALLLWAMFPTQATQTASNYVFFGFVISAGAIAGDMFKSFFKRRLGKKSGEEWFLVDQLDFVVGALIASWWIHSWELGQLIVMVIITAIVHKIANVIAFKARLKNVPW